MAWDWDTESGSLPRVPTASTFLGLGHHQHCDEQSVPQSQTAKQPGHSLSGRAILSCLPHRKRDPQGVKISSSEIEPVPCLSIPLGPYIHLGPRKPFQELLERLDYISVLPTLVLYIFPFPSEVCIL